MALGLLLVLGDASTHAEETQPATQKAEPEAAPTDSIAGPVEGLRVHGHWTIEVRDPDGTLVERREFENALSIPTGATHLANLFGRVRSVGGWRVILLGAPNPICEFGGTPASCEIIESTDTLVSEVAFDTLVVSVSASTPAELVLNGSAIAQRDGAVNTVRTQNLYCTSAVSPDSCPGATTGVVGTVVTSTDLTAGIAVLTGQQVQVNVVISFS